MSEDRPVSRSAAGVCFIRAQLDAIGVVDDPLAKQMLPPRQRRALDLLRRGPLSRLVRLSSGPYLAVRTWFFDRFVTDAIDGGIRQIVILAAGFDTRAWRLARPDVSFFEVDRPATQAVKRAGAPAGGPAFVPSDVTDERLLDRLVTAGVRPDDPIAFVAEGLVIYMERSDVVRLFTRLSEFAAPGSRLAVSFEFGFQHKPVMRRIMLAYYRQSRETYRMRLPRDDAGAFFSSAGWTMTDTLTPASLAPDYLAGSTLAGVPIDSPSYFVLASR